VLEQGVHIVNPLAAIEKMSVREQNFPQDGGIERMDAQTSEQLTVTLEVAILYKIDGQRAPELYQRLGTEEQIKNRIVLNAMRNGVRDAIATKSINDVFSPNRRELAAAMSEAIQTKAGDRMEVIEVFVRDITAPPTVKDAIEAKLAREQQVQSERFQTEIIQEKAKQKIEEAKGIAEAQKIINVDLTDRYLMLRYIEALQNLPQGSLVIAPTQGGLPLLLNPGNR
jgi:regulator of protease activity HflC (stomatin/prohibitin superfamily)